MAVRWVGLAAVEAEKKFRRIRGWKDLPVFLRNLESQMKNGAMDKRETEA